MNQKITFPELIDMMAHKQKCSKREAENFLRELMTLMTDTVSSGEALRINSLGTFKPVWVEERVSVNVQTGEPYKIPGHYKLTFTPVKAVREAVNEPFSCFVVEVLPDDAPCIEVPQISDEMSQKAEDDVESGIEMSDEQPADEDVIVPMINDEKVHDEEARQEDVGAIDVPIEENIDAQAADAALDEPEEQPEEVNAVSVEPLQIADPIQEVGPIVTENVEKFDEIVKKAYRKGVWIGLCVAFVLFALLALGFYLYQTKYFIKPDNMPIVHHTLVADTAVTENVRDSAVVASTSQDTVVIANEPVSSVVTETVNRGVFLTNISLKHYGHKAFWVYIYQENSHIIANPDNVPAGTVVVIPPAQKYGIDAADTVAVNKALKIADEIKQLPKR